MRWLPEGATDSVVIGFKEENIITVGDSNLVLWDIDENDKVKGEFTIDKGEDIKIKADLTLLELTTTGVRKSQ